MVPEVSPPGSLGPTPTSPGLGVLGPLLIDGSCIRHPVSELCRSARRVAMVDPDANLLREVSAPARPPFAQSPQAAENPASCGIGVCVGGRVDACSDCANVVKQYSLGLDV
eukprot:3697576-Pyramimonas_sp.AAC.1